MRRCSRAGAEMLECMQELFPILESATFKSAGAKRKAWQAYVDAVRGCLDAKRAAASEVWTATSFTSEIPIEERTPIRRLLDQIKYLAPRATFTDWETQAALERELLPLKRAIYGAASAIDASYAKHKRSLGALDFHDLLRRAASLLEDNPSVRAEYADRFRHILLDEAQDTDELQYRIIESLRTPDNVLFMVGDPKQAIYEFRGANPDVFHAAVSKLPADGRLDLAENFRSRREIVSMINGFGPPLLAEQFVTIDAKADYGDDDLPSPAVTVIYAEQQTDETGKKHEPVSEARPREAASVAEEIVRLLKEAPLVRDPDVRDGVVGAAPAEARRDPLPHADRDPVLRAGAGRAWRAVRHGVGAGVLRARRGARLHHDAARHRAAARRPGDGGGAALALRRRVGCRPLATAHAERGERTGDLAGAASVCAAVTSSGARSVRCARAYEVCRRPSRSRTRSAPSATRRRSPRTRTGRRCSPTWRRCAGRCATWGAVSPLEAYDELQRARELLTQGVAGAARRRGRRRRGADDDPPGEGTGVAGRMSPEPPVAVERPPAGFSARHGALLCKAIDAEGNEVWPLSLQSVSDEMRERAEAEERRLLYVALTRARERLILSACVKAELGAGERADVRPEAVQSARLPPGERPRGRSRTRGSTTAAPTARACGYVREPVEERTIYHGGKPLAATWTPPSSRRAASPTRRRSSRCRSSLKVTELLAYRRCPQVYRFSHELEIDENLAAPRGGAKRRVATARGGHAGRAGDDRALAARARAVRRARPAGEVARLVAEQPASAAARTDAHARRRARRRDRRGDRVGEARRARVAVRDAHRRRAGGGSDRPRDPGRRTARWTVWTTSRTTSAAPGRLEYLIDYYTPQLELYAMALARAGLGEVRGVRAGLPRRTAGAPLGVRAAGDWRWSEEIVARIAARDYATTAGPKCDLCGYRKRKVCGVGRRWTPRQGTVTPKSLPIVPS